jgi:hypothetical protein
MAKNRLQEAAEGMRNLEFPPKLLSQVQNIFFGFCRELGIKQGTPFKRNGKVVGYTIAKADWVMVRDAFLKHLGHKLEWHMLMSDVPDDLKG